MTKINPYDLPKDEAKRDKSIRITLTNIVWDCNDPNPDNAYPNEMSIPVHFRRTEEGKVIGMSDIVAKAMDQASLAVGDVSILDCDVLPIQFGNDEEHARVKQAFQMLRTRLDEKYGAGQTKDLWEKMKKEKKNTVPATPSHTGPDKGTIS